MMPDAFSSLSSSPIASPMALTLKEGVEQNPSEDTLKSQQMLNRAKTINAFQRDVKSMSDTYSAWTSFRKKIWCLLGGSEESFYFKKQLGRIQNIIQNLQAEKIQYSAAIVEHIDHLKEHLVTWESSLAENSGAAKEYQSKLNEVRGQLLQAKMAHFKFEDAAKRSGALPNLESVPSPLGHERDQELSEQNKLMENSFAKLMTIMQSGAKIQPHLTEMAELLDFMEAQVNPSAPSDQMTPVQKVWTEKLAEFRSELARLNLNAETWTTIIKMKPFARVNVALQLQMKEYEKNGDEAPIQESVAKLKKILEFLQQRNLNPAIAKLMEKQLEKTLQSLDKFNLENIQSKQKTAKKMLQQAQEAKKFAELFKSETSSPKAADLSFFSTETPDLLQFNTPPSNTFDLETAAECLEEEINSYRKLPFSPTQSRVLFKEALDNLEKFSELIAEIDDPVLKKEMNDKYEILKQKLEPLTESIDLTPLSLEATQDNLIRTSKDYDTIISGDIETALSKIKELLGENPRVNISNQYTMKGYLLDLEYLKERWLISPGKASLIEDIDRIRSQLKTALQKFELESTSESGD